EDIDDRDYLFLARLRDTADLVEAGRSANLTVVGAPLSEGLEHYLSDQKTAFIWQFGERFVGVPGQSAGHRSDGFVVLQTERFAVSTARLPVVPGTHQGVLEDRELIGIVADVVQKARDQWLGDLPACDTDRTR